MITPKSKFDMYTGIIHGTYPIVRLERKPGLISFTIEVGDELVKGIKQGASLAIDGVCLSVVAIEGNKLSFDVIGETFEKTTLAELQVGDRVNVERSARMDDEVGGHQMAGHIFGTAEIVKVEKPENNHIVTLRVPPDWMRYILQKGFIALDGASLTVVDPQKDKGTFDVHLIPETLRNTTFGWKREGDRVNVEIDNRTQVIVDTVEAMLKNRN